MDTDKQIGDRQKKQNQLEQIAVEISKCTNCTLHQSRNKSVPGVGPADSPLMLIGEGPGFHENEQGLPFVGAAGKLLDELLASIDLKRNDVYITNVVKCRPPGNRDPQADELMTCDVYLNQQIEIIQPKVIVTLGRFSMAKFIPNVKITQVHGQARHIGDRLVVAMFHPAAALHQISLKPLLEQDFKQLPHLISDALNEDVARSKNAIELTALVSKDESQTQPINKPEQLSLF